MSKVILHKHKQKESKSYNINTKIKFKTMKHFHENYETFLK